MTSRARSRLRALLAGTAGIALVTGLLVRMDVGAGEPATPGEAVATSAEPGTATLVRARDPWLRPFSSRSIWNMPIGSGAVYVPAGLEPAPTGVGLDRLLLVRTVATDPRRPILQPGHWQHRCSGTTPTGLAVHVPDALVIPDARTDDRGAWVTPNNVAAFLQPDGRTLVNVNAVARCDRGGPVFAYATRTRALDVTDLYGDGILGAHGGSRLSGLGGAIRRGELGGVAPIRHALDLVISAEHLHFGAGRGYRWPARTADAYASPATYRGTVPALRMGALLAVPPSVSPAGLGLTTTVARKVFAALRDHGGYVTDDAGWDHHYLGVDAAAFGTFDWGQREQAEVNRVFAALAVVANNGPSSIGGGGVPRLALLPELVPR